MSAPALKILSIDDRTMTTDLDRAGYKNMGVIVKAARDYQEAEALLKSESIDVVQINHDFRKADGLAICKHLKAQAAYREIPIVITSVQTSAATRDAALAAGADLFVEQPIPRQYFIEKVKRLLAQKTRGTDRVSIHGNATISYEGESRQCPIGDLSLSGMLLAGKLELRLGLSIDVEFALPGYKKPLHIKGEVVRILKPSETKGHKSGGIGVKFVEFVGESQKRLDKYISKSNDEQHGMLYYL